MLVSISGDFSAKWFCNAAAILQLFAKQETFSSGALVACIRTVQQTHDFIRTPLNVQRFRKMFAGTNAICLIQLWLFAIESWPPIRQCICAILLQSIKVKFSVDKTEHWEFDFDYWIINRPVELILYPCARTQKGNCKWNQLLHHGVFNINLFLYKYSGKHFRHSIFKNGGPGDAVRLLLRCHKTF